MGYYGLAPLRILSHDKQLSIILRAWPTLPAPLKDAILALIQSILKVGIRVIFRT
jgi:hypothetical protein